MTQIKIFGLKPSLDAHKIALSGAIHNAVVEALAYPADKKFHRFIALDEGDFLYPEGRSRNYTVIEISMFEGRSVATKKQLIKLILKIIERKVEIKRKKVEIKLFETPKGNGGTGG
ncbi:MAG: tautomerase family protein, partial [Cyanophyceae cyanobacterium]